MRKSLYGRIIAGAAAAAGAGVAAMLALVPAAAAQSPGASYGAAQCKAAVTALADTDGRDAAAAAIYDSAACAKLREAKAFDVRREMEAMKAKMRAQGIDYDANLAARKAACAASADARLAAPLPPGEKPADRADLIAACAANAEVVLYAEGIAALNKAADNSYAEALAANAAEEARIAREAAEAQAAYESKVAAQKAAFAAEMDAWRRAVALCESGQVEYCAKPQ